MMDDFKESERFDEEEVHIEDLGAPDKGLGLIIFSLNQKLRSSNRLRTMPVALALLVCLLTILLLPGSSFIQSGVPASPSSSASSLQGNGCSQIIVVVSTASVIRYTISSDPTPSSSGTTYTCGSVQILTPVPPPVPRKPQP